MDLVKLPPYAAHRFVDREEEYGKVVALVNAARQREAKRTRAITFYGERGSGKTWFCLQLCHAIPQDKPDVSVLFISLQPRRPELEHVKLKNAWFWPKQQQDATSEPAIDDILRNSLWKWLAQLLDIMWVKNADYGELTYWLERDLGSRQHPSAYVLCLDSAFESETAVLELVEKHLLAPFLNLPNSLIVLTGRGKDYPWKTPHLRLRAENAILHPFPKEYIYSQLIKQLENSQSRVTHELADAIWELGGGYPLSNFVLGASPHPEEALERLVEELLSVVVPAEQIPEIRNAVAALCVLQRFRDSEIAIMIGFDQDGAKADAQLPPEVMRTKRDRLIQQSLMRWHDDGYELNSSLKIAMRSYLRLREPARFQRLVQRAVDLYHSWAQQLPKAAGYYSRCADEVRNLLPATSMPTN